MHRLLARQLSRAGIDPKENLRPEWAALLKLVDASYAAADLDRATMTRSLELTSADLLESNRTLRHDLAEKRRAEAELSRIIEMLPQAVFLVRDGTIVYANPTAVRLLACDAPTELVGRRMVELVATECTVDDLLWGAPAREYHLVARRGPFVVVERDLVDDVSFQGQAVSLVVYTDVTEKRKLEGRVQIADRMAALGTLAAGVAHEINNPLCYVLTNLEFATATLAEHGRRDALGECIEALSDASVGARRVERIVAALKTFSRPDDEKRRHLSLNGVLETAMDLSTAITRHRAGLVRQLRPLPSAFGNEGRLVQVFVNLLNNAADAVGDKNGTIVVRSFERSEFVGAEISDNGAGIPEHLLSQIFEPFFTTKAASGGTGLGLSICHGIMTSLGGKLEVESTVGLGTTFRVLVPRGGEATPEEAPPSSGVARRARVLVVDDEPAIGQSLRRALVEHDVVSVESAPSALRELRRTGYDVIVCDLMMPGAGGDALFAAVLRREPELAKRFIFVTAGAVTSKSRAFIEEVRQPILMKPFTMEKVRGVIDAMLTAG